MSDVDRDTVFKEAAAFHGRMLNWRHAAFAGCVAAVAGTAKLTLDALPVSLFVAALIPLPLAALAQALLVIDGRTRQLYNAAQNVAAELQRGNDANLYDALMESHKSPDRGAEGVHTKALARFYRCVSDGALLLSSGLFLWAVSNALQAA